MMYNLKYVTQQFVTNTDLRDACILKLKTIYIGTNTRKQILAPTVMSTMSVIVWVLV
jgi:hypothetical protein